MKKSLADYIKPVFKILQSLPKGTTITYKELAQKCHVPTPRNIGWILQKNTDPNRIPCYKVIRSDGSLAKGYKFGGQTEQKKRLVAEGVRFDVNGKIQLQ